MPILIAKIKQRLDWLVPVHVLTEYPNFILKRCQDIQSSYTDNNMEQG